MKNSVRQSCLKIFRMRPITGRWKDSTFSRCQQEDPARLNSEFVTQLYRLSSKPIRLVCSFPPTAAAAAVEMGLVAGGLGKGRTLPYPVLAMPGARYGGMPTRAHRRQDDYCAVPRFFVTRRGQRARHRVEPERGDVKLFQDLFHTVTPL
jgi:hypothetical protein